MPTNEDPRVVLCRETKKRLELHRINNDFKSHDKAVEDLLNKVESFNNLERKRLKK